MIGLCSPSLRSLIASHPMSPACLSTRKWLARRPSRVHEGASTLTCRSPKGVAMVRHISHSSYQYLLTLILLSALLTLTVMYRGDSDSASRILAKGLRLEVGHHAATRANCSETDSSAPGPNPRPSSMPSRKKNAPSCPRDGTLLVKTDLRCRPNRLRRLQSRSRHSQISLLQSSELETFIRSIHSGSYHERPPLTSYSPAWASPHERSLTHPSQGFDAGHSA